MYKKFYILLIWLNIICQENYLDLVPKDVEKIVSIFQQNNKLYGEKFGEIEQEDVIPAFILLNGPSGAGKSSLARNIAKKIDAHLIEISGPSVVQKYIGDGANKIKEQFEEAESYSKLGLKVIIFIDEVDAFAGRNFHNEDQDGEWGAATQELQRQLDKCNKCCTMFIATTNYIHRINNPLLMRMTCVHKMEYPNHQERKNIINFSLKKLDLSLDEKSIDKLTKNSYDMSIRDIKQAILLGAATELKTEADFLDSFRYIRKIRSNKISWFEKAKKLNKDYGEIFSCLNNIQTGTKLLISFTVAAILITKCLKDGSLQELEKIFTPKAI